MDLLRTGGAIYETRCLRDNSPEDRTNYYLSLHILKWNRYEKHMHTHTLTPKYNSFFPFCFLFLFIYL